MTKEIHFSGSPWEKQYAYARAVRRGHTVFVAGTVANDEGRLVGAGSAYEQAKFIYAKIEKALQALGAEMSDVVRTRVFLTDMRYLDEAGRAHAETFAGIFPVNTTLQVSALAGEGYLMEIEAEAVIQGSFSDKSL